MPESSLYNANTTRVDKFDSALAQVMKELDKLVVDILAGTVTTGAAFDLAAVVNSRAAMIDALRLSGYNKLVEEFIAEYPDITVEVREYYKTAKLPPPAFSTADATTFKQISALDTTDLMVGGQTAMHELHMGLYRQAVVSAPFSEMVESIAAATVGTAKNGSPLSNYAYTHANTAVFRFTDQVVKTAGESIGATEWIVTGPLDAKTRQVCRDALNAGVQTQEEWEDDGYWTDRGGWNCRHTYSPYVGATAKGILDNE